MRAGLAPEGTREPAGPWQSSGLLVDSRSNER